VPAGSRIRAAASSGNSLRFFALVVGLVLALVPPSSAEGKPPLAGIRRVIFLGDSITYGGDYVDQFELFLRLDDPQHPVEVLDLGLPSETVSGLSEQGHADGKFPRPDLHERLDRVLEKTKPDLVFACYGMNDGIYMPYSEERMDAFRSGMRRLHEKVTARGAKIVHLTPPVFDAVPLGEKTSPDGIGAPFAGYDQVLQKYSAWLLEQRVAGWQVIDLHGPMLRALQAKRAENPAFRFANDGVHCDAAGHAIMAAALIDGIYDSAKFQPDAAAEHSTALKLIRQRRKILSDAWLTACGHQRPGMNPGLPLNQAETKSQAIEQELSTALGH
jgi:lysophospholipase L1-like esterase